MTHERTYTVTLERTDENDTVLQEAEYEVDVTMTSRGSPAIGPSLSRGSLSTAPSLYHPGEPGEPPEFEIVRITETWNNAKISPDHPNYDEICDKAMDQAYDDDWTDDED